MVNYESIMNEIANNCITEIAKYVMEKLKGLPKIAVEKVCLLVL